MDYLNLDNASLWALVMGFVSPPVISLIQQSRWSARVQSLVALAFYLVLAAGTAWFSGLFNLGDYLRLALLIFLTGATSYQTLWKPTGASPAIEAATTWNNEPQHPTHA